MASTIAVYTGDGITTDFTVPFDYLAKKFVRVSVGLTVLNGGDYGDTSKDYYFLAKTTVRLRTPPQAGAEVIVRRYTSATDRIVSFKDASILKATDLDTSSIQTIHIAEEGRDVINDALIIDKYGNFDAKGRRIVNVGDPVNDGDAVNFKTYKADAMGAFQSRIEAEKARDRAIEAAANAKESEVNATAQAVIATQKATEAESSADASHQYAVQAEASAKNSANSASLAAAQATASANSAIAAKLSEDNAALHEDSASSSAAMAKSYEVEAKKQADLARVYANQSATGQMQSDWDQTDSTQKDYIRNKPNLGVYALEATVNAITKELTADVTGLQDALKDKLNVATFDGFVDYGDLGNQ